MFTNISMWISKNLYTPKELWCNVSAKFYIFLGGMYMTVKYLIPDIMHDPEHFMWDFLNNGYQTTLVYIDRLEKEPSRFAKMIVRHVE